MKVLRLGYQVVKLDEKAEAVTRRIEQRGPIAKDVTLDVQIHKPQATRSLLDEITRNKYGK